MNFKAWYWKWLSWVCCKWGRPVRQWQQAGPAGGEGGSTSNGGGQRTQLWRCSGREEGCQDGRVAGVLMRIGRRKHGFSGPVEKCSRAPPALTNPAASPCLSSRLPGPAPPFGYHSQSLTVSGQVTLAGSAC